jgi:hypothetical protein
MKTLAEFQANGRIVEDGEHDILSTSFMFYSHHSSGYEQTRDECFSAQPFSRAML